MLREVRAALSRLGDTRLSIASSAAWSLDRLDDGDAGMPEEVDAFATADGTERVSLLVWRHADDQYATDPRDADVTVRLKRLPFGGRVRIEHWRIDAHHSNSHAAWRALGAPQDPSPAQLAAITERQGLEPLEPERTESIRDGTLALRIALPLSSVSLLEIRPAR